MWSLERLFKENPYTVAFLGLIGLGVVASTIQEIGTAMSGVFVQLGWCEQDNYVCKIAYWGLIVIILLYLH